MKEFNRLHAGARVIVGGQLYGIVYGLRMADSGTEIHVQLDDGRSGWFSIDIVEVV